MAIADVNSILSRSFRIDQLVTKSCDNIEGKITSLVRS